MELRAVTGFARDIAAGAARVREVATRLAAAGHTVQMTRLATPPWPQWCAPAELPSQARAAEATIRAAGVDFVSLGPCAGAQAGAAVAALCATERTFCSAWLDDRMPVARAILALAAADPQLNLRFAGLAGVGPATPFFPAAYASTDADDEGFALALEATPELLAAGGDVAALAPVLTALERDARAAGWRCLGIDTSLAPGLGGRGSVAELMTLRGTPVGSSGAADIVGVLTSELRALPVRQVGYRGVMFAVMEDRGLVAAVERGELSIAQLLEYAGRCGTGLDTVPLPGGIAPEALAALLARVSGLAQRKRKPLSARLFPAPGVAVGEPVRTGSPYLYDCPAMDPEG